MSSESLHFSFASKNCTLILDAGGSPSDSDLDSPKPYTIAEDFTFDTPACYIYAEDIVLSTDLKLPGKVLGLFCNTLTVASTIDPKTKKPVPTTINVSGEDGVSNATDDDARNGGDGGNVYLYVENMDDSILQNLRIVSNGGNGATGMDNAGGLGGPGGNGGNGGEIQVVFGSVFSDIGVRAYNGTSQPWVMQVKTLVDSIMPAIKLKQLSDSVTFGYSDSQVTSWDGTLDDYSTYVDDVQKLQASLALLFSPPIDSGGDPSDETLDLAQQLSDSIQTLVDSPNAPTAVPDSTEDIETLETAIDSFIKIGGNKKEAEVISALSSVKSVREPTSKTSDLNSAIDSIVQTSLGLLEQLVVFITHSWVEANAGRKGMGGISSHDAASPNGPAGTDGTPGYSKAKYLGLDGRVEDSDVDIAYAFPEQCRMLLNIADYYYFVSDQKSWTAAARLYDRISKRLSFIEKLTQDSKIAKAYSSLEADDRITYHPLSEIQSVYSTAQGRLNQLKLGHDMFGHSDSWVPRLSAAYYKDRVDTMLQQLGKLETAVDLYVKEHKDDTKQRTQAQVGIQNSSGALSNAQDRIQLLSGPGGILRSYERQIATYAPLLGPARDAVLDAIKNVTKDIQNNININPEDIISAFTMLAMCPSKVMAAAEFGQELFKATTTVAGDDGVDVNKSYVIKQLNTCSDTLASLNEAFKQNTDGTIDLDDPGASIVLAQKDDIDSLMEKFAKAIPKSDSDAVNEAFQTYTTLISKRNTAVMEYNCSLQLLAQAISDKQDYERQTKKWGEVLLTLPTDLPAIVLWLRKSRDDLRFQIMQRLNFQSRAIWFWGLSPIAVMNSPGPLMDSADLIGDQNKLDSATEDSISFLANNNMQALPPPGKPGAFYQISDEDLESLKSHFTTVSEPPGKVYSTTITIAPGDIPDIATGRNIRLTEVRVWLVGVKSKVPAGPLGDQLFSLNVIHNGTETIQDTLSRETSFTHDPVIVSFEYYCNKVKSYRDCLADNVAGVEGLGGDYNGSNYHNNINAPIGPYADWTITIATDDKSNRGLDLSGVTAGYFEFAVRKQGKPPVFRAAASAHGHGGKERSKHKVDRGNRFNAKSRQI
ncbi:hypothetical protein Dda_3746 [Drechslerella dactyloides]|uniref:Uncharacterized protein n=1 Tax=Drechslerella dactyloides TaxID=74499 RepID=A0AAD6IYY9_DREDA|nr:hypothetical protein Dda_3746 [Drechslerella dactyloides]